MSQIVTVYSDVLLLYFAVSLYATSVLDMAKNAIQSKIPDANEFFATPAEPKKVVTSALKKLISKGSMYVTVSLVDKWEWKFTRTDWVACIISIEKEKSGAYPTFDELMKMKLIDLPLACDQCRQKGYIVEEKSVCSADGDAIMSYTFKMERRAPPPATLKRAASPPLPPKYEDTWI